MTARFGRSLTRLFSYQGSWNFERLQGIGMAYCIEPLLHDLNNAQDGDRFRRAMARASMYFNTHPFLAGLAIGAVAKAELTGVDEAHIERLRTALKGPVGSIGDRLVWSGALPVATAAGLVAAAWGPPLLGPAVFLLVFNCVHLPLRVWALRSGWRLGVGVAGALQHRWLQKLTELSGPAALVALGFAIPIALQWLLADHAGTARGAVAAIAVVTFIVSRWLVPTLGAARLGALAVVTTVIAGALWL